MMTGEVRAAWEAVSGAASGFARAMGFEDGGGRSQPGVSSFHRTPVGTIVRVAAAPFGPGDDFCAVRPLLDQLRDGLGGFVPQ